MSDEPGFFASCVLVSSLTAGGAAYALHGNHPIIGAALVAVAVFSGLLALVVACRANAE